MTIGNIYKEIRCQQSSRTAVLIGYLPISKLQCFREAGDSRKFAVYCLFHHCMRIILKPLITAGKYGIEIACANKYIRRIFPILAAYVADYLEQCLVTCCMENRCPCCVIKRDKRGENTESPLYCQASTLDMLSEHKNGEYPILQLYFTRLRVKCTISLCYLLI